MRIVNLALLVVPLLSLVLAPGCYSGYAIKPTELDKVQAGTETKVVEIAAEDGTPLVVTGDTGLQVVDRDGLTYRLQPYNFKITATQVLDPEQDLVLPIGSIERVEVRKLNTWGTVGLIAVGAAAAAGIVIGIAATAGEDTGFE